MIVAGISWFAGGIPEHLTENILAKSYTIPEEIIEQSSVVWVWVVSSIPDCH